MEVRQVIIINYMQKQKKRGKEYRHLWGGSGTGGHNTMRRSSPNIRRRRPTPLPGIGPDYHWSDPGLMSNQSDCCACLRGRAGVVCDTTTCTCHEFIGGSQVFRRGGPTRSRNFKKGGTTLGSPGSCLDGRGNNVPC